MLARVCSSVTYGIEAISVSVEIDVSAGLPGFSIVGLPDRAVRESVVRVRSALRNSGYRFPRRKVTVNLAPGGIPKEGPVFDLPIALGILVASGQLEQEMLNRKMVVGELALNGSLCAVRGILPRIIDLVEKKDWGCVIPQDNALEAQSVEGIGKILAASNLLDTVNCLNRSEFSQLPPRPRKKIRKKRKTYDFSHVRGQMQAKRGLLVAAAGGHNVLLIGPPGAGKTMLARCVPGVLSAMARAEGHETSRIHSVAGLFNSTFGLIDERPFRAPHHTASTVALAGGGSGIPRPGEVSLAHNGVLFLDELPEFRRDALEVLRQPLEEGQMRIARSGGNFTFPARFMLVSAMNPCPCGYYGTAKECVCTDIGIKRYRSRVSGPLIDRIDIHLDVPALKVDEMEAGIRGDLSLVLRQKVECCRKKQAQRYHGLDDRHLLNAHLDVELIERFCQPNQEGKALLRQAVDGMGLSTRAYHRVLKVARTIADLDESDLIMAPHVAEAIGYRLLDRDLRS